MTEAPAAIADRLRTLARRADLTTAELVQALSDFDRVEGWRMTGAKDCIRWICSELGLCRSLAYERLRVARALRGLPLLRELFGNGDLSWSKIRALTQVATVEDERALAVMALDADANTVRRRCDEYRWGKRDGADIDDAERDRLRFADRAVVLGKRPDGMVEIRATLPPDMAANLLRCLERQEELLFKTEGPPASSSDVDDDKADRAASRPTPAQRRADALVAMAEASLSGTGAPAATGDRFNVVAHVDAEALYEAERELARETGDPDAPLPIPLRAAIAGFLGGGISPATARRLACDGTLVTLIMENGEPIAVGRKLRTANPAMRRAVLARDGGCTFPGCGATRQLDVHHVHGWALGGATSVEGMCTLCRSCHTRVHEEGWRIRRAEVDVTPRRSSAAARLLDDADARTRKIIERLDARRSAFVFERSRGDIEVPAEVVKQATSVHAVDDAAPMNRIGDTGGTYRVTTHRCEPHRPVARRRQRPDRRGDILSYCQLVSQDPPCPVPRTS